MTIQITDNRPDGGTYIAGEGYTPDAAVASLCRYVAELYASGAPILTA